MSFTIPTMIVRLLFFVALAQLSSAMQLNNGSTSLGISGGQEATDLEARFIVFIVSSPKNAEMKDTKYRCGGSLLTKSLVLTAARCVRCGQTIDYILAGARQSSWHEQSQQKLYYEAHEIHPKYNSPPGANDIAMIKMQSEVTLSMHVSLVKLPRQQDANKDYVGKKATAYGWGETTGVAQSYAEALRKVNARVMKFNECHRKSKVGNVYPSDICTDGMAEMGTCKGDTGGPVMFEGVQIGIISRSGGDGCSSCAPSIHTKVSSYLSWIQITMKNL